MSFSFLSLELFVRGDQLKLIYQLHPSACFVHSNGLTTNDNRFIKRLFFSKVLDIMTQGAAMCALKLFPTRLSIAIEGAQYTFLLIKKIQV